jgi:hypothetical protein
MTRANVEPVIELARLAGIALADGEASEVADRFYALMRELDSLASLDLADIEPVAVFADENSDGR